MKAAVPRLMCEAYPAPLEDRIDPLADDDRESQSARRPRETPASGRGAVMTSPRTASQTSRRRVIDDSNAPMALATDQRPERIPPVDDSQADAPRLLTSTSNEQWSAARPLGMGGPSETAGELPRRAPLADRLAALQDQVPSSYVGIQGRVGAINLGDRTAKLNFDRRQPPPLGGLVHVYQVRSGGTICIGTLKISRVYGGVATGSPVGELQIERIVSGDVVVFHVGSTAGNSDEPDLSEAVWVSDRIRSLPR
jgi:hypothetical protein